MSDQVKRGIEIEDGVKERCPKCGSVYRIKNNNEGLYRNITLLYFRNGKVVQVKCKQCKELISVEASGGPISAE